jgi:hypothetical protein
MDANKVQGRQERQRDGNEDAKDQGTKKKHDSRNAEYTAHFRLGRREMVVVREKGWSAFDWQLMA